MQVKVVRVTCYDHRRLQHVRAVFDGGNKFVRRVCPTATQQVRAQKLLPIGRYHARRDDHHNRCKRTHHDIIPRRHGRTLAPFGIPERAMKQHVIYPAIPQLLKQRARLWLQLVRVNHTPFGNRCVQPLSGRAFLQLHGRHFSYKK